MAILWCGGEDIDFPVGTGTMSFAATSMRAKYARGSVNNGNTTRANVLQTKPFPGGAVTSAWFSAQVNPNVAVAAQVFFGVGLSTTAKGLYIGTDASEGAKLCLYKYDGTTATALASESGTSFSAGGPYKVDMQVVNYGASATVNVFLNNILVITYSGDVTVSGMTNFDCVTLTGHSSSGGMACRLSEVIVADEDTRPLLGLLTMAPTAAGTTDQWTGLYSAVNPTTINDANSNYTNTDAQDQQYNVTDEPSGAFVVKAVKIAARAWMTAGATADNIKLGFNSGGSVAVGASQAVSTGATTYEQLWDATNPVTSAAWGDATEINALQINLRSSST